MAHIPTKQKRQARYRSMRRMNSHAKGSLRPGTLRMYAGLTSFVFAPKLKIVLFGLSFLIGGLLSDFGRLVEVQPLFWKLLAGAFVLEFSARMWDAIKTGAARAEGGRLGQVQDTVQFVAEAIWDRLTLYLALLVVLMGVTGLHNAMVAVENDGSSPHLISVPSATGGLLVAIYTVVFVLLLVETIVWVLGSRQKAKDFLSRLGGVWDAIKERDAEGAHGKNLNS